MTEPRRTHFVNDRFAVAGAVAIACLTICVGLAFWVLISSRQEAISTRQEAIVDRDRAITELAEFRETSLCRDRVSSAATVALLEGGIAEARYVLSLNVPGDQTPARAAVEAALRVMETKAAERAATEQSCPG